MYVVMRSRRNGVEIRGLWTENDVPVHALDNGPERDEHGHGPGQLLSRGDNTPHGRGVFSPTLLHVHTTCVTRRDPKLAEQRPRDAHPRAPHPNHLLTMRDPPARENCCRVNSAYRRNKKMRSSLRHRRDALLWRRLCDPTWFWKPSRVTCPQFPTGQLVPNVP